MLFSLITIEGNGGKLFDLSDALHAMVITPFWSIIAGHALHIAVVILKLTCHYMQNFN